jgi:hypothetical protein
MSAGTAGRLARRTVLWALPIGFLGGSGAHSHDSDWWRDAGNLAYVVPLSLLFGFLVALDGWLDERKAATARPLAPGRHERPLRWLRRALAVVLLGGFALLLMSERVGGDEPLWRGVRYASVVLFAALAAAYVVTWFRNERSRGAVAPRSGVRD